jgi:SAM-dependent methyltransferase
METARSIAQQLAQTSWAQGDPTGWFEVLYANANGNPTAVPWADMAPNPNLLDWLEQHSIRGEGKSALVIGCGLGDDAEALAALGFRVTAFDLSPTAIAWCQRRFPDTLVTYCVADLFALPTDWAARFDFGLEAYTLQALPATVRSQAMTAIANCIAPQGQLLVICRGRDATDPVSNLPFPLTPEELSTFTEAGLIKLKFEDYIEPEVPSVRRFRVLYGKNALDLNPE